MARVAVVVTALFLLCINHALAFERMDVIAPPALVAKHHTFDERPAFFGKPPYGDFIQGRVFYAPLDATTGQPDGCQNISTSAIQMYDMPHPGVTFDEWVANDANTAILLVDRGNCSFVTKVRHAQDLGFAAVIVLDVQNVTTFLPYMADDSSGSDIFIPSVLIHHNDGEEIKSYIDQSPGRHNDSSSQGETIVKMVWGLRSPDDRVEWRLWTSCHDPNAVEFEEVFGAADEELGVHAEFEPRFYTYDGRQYGCYNTNRCADQCTNNGLYCAVDPEGQIGRGNSGADVLKENVQQYCLWQHLNSTGKSHLWWKYANDFRLHCENGGQWLNDATWKLCARNIMSEIDVDHRIVDSCYNQSGGFDGETNSILELMVDKAKEDLIFFHPMVIVNEDPYRGSLGCPLPLRRDTCGPLNMICSAFNDDSNIGPCSLNWCGTPGLYRDSCGICGGDNSCEAANSGGGGVKTQTVVGIVIAVVVVVALLMGAAGYVYMKRQRQEMQMGVDRILQSYMPVDDKRSQMSQPVLSDDQNEDGDEV